MNAILSDRALTRSDVTPGVGVLVPVRKVADMAKYDALHSRLRDEADEVASLRLTFDEIGEMVGPLPPSAREYRPWWGNNDSSPQAAAWMHAGWRVDNVNQTAGWVVFRRVSAPVDADDDLDIVLLPPDEPPKVVYSASDIAAGAATPGGGADTPELRAAIGEFLDRVRREEVELYNEASLQYELAIHLRHSLDPAWKIQLERPVDYFGLHRASGFVKKEIDIVVFTEQQAHAIELKLPMRGQYPEQLYSFCKDILFLEQMVRAGFGTCYFLAVVADRLFWEGRTTDGIYAPFRGHASICGEVRKPTGDRDESLRMAGQHAVTWDDAGAGRKYALVEVGA